MPLTSSIPVLRASDYPTSRDFMFSLGFELREAGGDPPRFGIFARDAARLFVDAWAGADERPSPRWRGYFHCDDLDSLIADFRNADVRFEGPHVTNYAMREVVVVDPDGNRLCFGEDA